MVVLHPRVSDPVDPRILRRTAEAYVEPSAAGGISRVLLATALAWAYDNGHRYLSARWPAVPRCPPGCGPLRVPAGGVPAEPHLERRSGRTARQLLSPAANRAGVRGGVRR